MTGCQVVYPELSTERYSGDIIRRFPVPFLPQLENVVIFFSPPSSLNQGDASSLFFPLFAKRFLWWEILVFSR